MSRWLVQSHPCHRIRRKIVETSEPIRPEYRSDVPMGGGLKRWKSANYAKTLSRELSGAVTAQNLETVESGRRWNGGRVASRRKGRYWGALAHVYEIRAARWYPPAFGYAFYFDHRCTRSHLDDWLYCMDRTLGEYHHTSIKGKGGVSEG